MILLLHHIFLAACHRVPWGFPRTPFSGSVPGKQWLSCHCRRYRRKKSSQCTCGPYWCHTGSLCEKMSQEIYVCGRFLQKLSEFYSCWSHTVEQRIPLWEDVAGKLCLWQSHPLRNWMNHIHKRYCWCSICVIAFHPPSFPPGQCLPNIFFTFLHPGRCKIGPSYFMEFCHASSSFTVKDNWCSGNDPFIRDSLDFV